MQYVVMRRKAEEDVDLFSDNDEDAEVINPITPEQYQTLMEYLEERNKPAVLPVQIAYYTGLRLGEVCGLSWSDINFEEQYLTVRRSVRYNGARHKTEIGPTKRKKVRIVDFCDTLADILKKAKRNRESRYSVTENSIRGTTTGKLRKRIVSTMSFIIWMAQRTFRLITTRLTLYVSDRTEHTKPLQRLRQL